MNDLVIETRGLTLYYGAHRGIVDVDLQVRAGEVFGFLGPNGAGKTTTQRILLDIIRPTSGHASIFGLDCQRQGVELRRRVGYLPGELALYTNMQADKFFEMYEYLRGANGDKGHWRELAARLDLDTSRKIREFSRGNKQKVGVVAAFMNRPDLLILDEPTSGLDPLVQQTVLELVREARAEGTTVFFSSHILSEVQAVCDRVGIIRDGRLVITQSVGDMIAQRLKRLRLQFVKMPPVGTFDPADVTEMERTDQEILLEVRDNLAQVMSTAAQFGIADIETHNVSLEEIFLTYYGRGNGENHV
ncbi:MAG: ABC transporter ATP-binding protein [Anaerolineales bacterium]|nr:ABC transporter ATP-binding protein [Anaerolineales bacterium]MCB8953195.1 ABC transporter ATP-binding protein [Ardenticatenales bacterium]